MNGRPNARSAEARIAYLLEQYDRRVAEVEKLKSRRNATRQQLDSARNRIQEQIRQVETRLDINRIQRAEASNKKSGDFKVTENRADLLKLQASLPQDWNALPTRGKPLCATRRKLTKRPKGSWACSKTTWTGRSPAFGTP